MRILLVEDHAQTRLALRRLLEQRGHRVTQAGTLADARRLCDGDRPFDLVLSDLDLPDGDGCELGDVARRCGVRAVAVSGHDPDQYAGRLDAFLTYLVKPISCDQLFAVVARCESGVGQAAQVFP